MGKKTVIRRLAKRSPVSVELVKAAVLDEYGEAGLPQDFTIDMPAGLNGDDQGAAPGEEPHHPEDLDQRDLVDAIRERIRSASTERELGDINADLARNHDALGEDLYGGLVQEVKVRQGELHPPATKVLTGAGNGGRKSPF